jgi:hypothetical protein
MPRNSTSRSSNNQSNYKVNKHTTVNPPAPLKIQPNQKNSTIPNNHNGFMENIKQGFAFGTGCALSRVFVDNIFGAINGNVQSKPENINMEEIHKKYFECINYASNPEESEKCEKIRIYHN